MKNILIFAAIAGIAAAIAIYFVSEQSNPEYDSDYIADPEVDDFDLV